MKLRETHLEKMKDLNFPSCFGENGVQVADFSSSSRSSLAKNPQNVVTCVYRCKLFGQSCLVTIVWSRNLMGQCLCVEINHPNQQSICKFDVKPSLFSKRKGSKFLETNSSKIDLFWDFSGAKFGAGPEPLEGFYLALVCEAEMVLLIGDLRKEAFKKTNASPGLSNSIFVSKKEHIFGKKVLCTRAQFCDNGPIHSLSIEFDRIGGVDPCLMIRVDSKPAIKVKRLQWKFRGNDTICVDGLPVEVFYDVHDWLFGDSGNAVFMFQTCLSAEKMWSSKTLSDPFAPHWACSESFKETKKLPGLGFSLILYAWKNE